MQAHAGWVMGLSRSHAEALMSDIFAVTYLMGLTYLDYNATSLLQDRRRLPGTWSP